jgi:hypothetical protein
MSKEEFYVAAFGLGRVGTDEAWAALKSCFEKPGELKLTPPFHAAIGQFGMKGFDIFLKLGLQTHEGTADDRLVGRISSELYFLKIDPKDASDVFRRGATSTDLLTRKYCIYAAFMAAGDSILPEAEQLFQTSTDTQLRSLLLQGVLTSVAETDLAPEHLDQVRSFVSTALAGALLDNERQFLYQVAGWVLSPELEQVLIGRHLGGDKTPSLLWELTRFPQGQELLASELGKITTSKESPKRFLSVLEAAMRVKHTTLTAPALVQALQLIEQSSAFDPADRLLAVTMLATQETPSVRQTAISTTMDLYTVATSAAERLAAINTLAKYIPDSTPQLLGIVQSQSEMTNKLDAFHYLASNPTLTSNSDVSATLQAQASGMVRQLINSVGQFDLSPLYEYYSAVQGSRLDTFADRITLLFAHGFNRETAPALLTLSSNLKYPEFVKVPPDWDRTIKNSLGDACRSAYDLVMTR